MIKNKKGMFFTIIAIILVAGLIFFYISSNRHYMKDDMMVIESRAMTMNSFIEDIEHDIDRGIYISSIRSIIGISQFMVQNGSFLNSTDCGSFNGCFNEIMFNGTIAGLQINLTLNHTFGNWTNKIIDLGKKIDVDIIFNDKQLTAYQDDPWDIKVKFTSNMNLTDRKGIASWQRALNITTSISIIEMEDPLYIVASEGKMTNKINMTNLDLAIDSNLAAFASNSSYKNSPTAPNFIMRFEGNFSPSLYGIESIVNVPELQVATGKSYSGKSSVDYILFGPNSTLRNCIVNETKYEPYNLTWFRLDNATDSHLISYDATGVDCVG